MRVKSSNFNSSIYHRQNRKKACLDKRQTPLTKSYLTIKMRALEVTCSQTVAEARSNKSQQSRIQATRRNPQREPSRCSVLHLHQARANPFPLGKTNRCSVLHLHQARANPFPLGKTNQNPTKRFLRQNKNHQKVCSLIRIWSRLASKSLSFSKRASHRRFWAHNSNSQ